VKCPETGRTVHDAAELTTALSSAGPGTVILLAAGTYDGQFTINRAANAARPAWLCGGRDAVLDGGGTKSGYGLHLQHADYWRIVGFTVTNSQKGVVLDTTSRAVVQSVDVHQIGDEAIHLRSTSTSNLVLENTVSGTGQHNQKFGEGIYVGSAKKNWCQWSGCQPDRSDYNVVARNIISGTTAENVDIKEGTQFGQLLDNSLSGEGGLTAADSWVDVKGNNWQIVNNRGKNSPNDGFQTHSVVNGWGSSNVFDGNVADVQGPGFGIHLTPVDENVVRCNNTQAGAAQGLSNVTCNS
jgi:hypothetical protein